MVYKVLIILVYTLGYLLSLQVSDFFFEREKKNFIIPAAWVYDFP